MKKLSLSNIEKEMLELDLDQLEMNVKEAKMALHSDSAAQDIKEKICVVWSKIGRFVKLAEKLPIVGKYVGILADLLDSICA